MSPLRLGLWPTPLAPLDSAPGVYVKREDLCGFAFGSSKVRALEPLLDHVLRAGADSVVVGGRWDSNWVALAAIAASRLGLGCHCIFDPGPATTNAMRLARRWQAEAERTAGQAAIHLVAEARAASTHPSSSEGTRT